MGIHFDSAADVPLAAFRARHLPHTGQFEQLWCLDPVHVRIDQEQAVLVTNDGLGLSESEARHLIEDLNHHFAEDQLTIHYLSPHQWLLQARFDLVTHTLAEVMEKNIDAHQPQGQDAGRWRRYINEAQMLLYTHPVNQARELRGEISANSLWLWGGADISQPAYQYEAIIDRVYANEHWLGDVAQICDIPFAALPDSIGADQLGQATLYLFTDQLSAIRGNDVYAWFAGLQHFEQHVLQPCIALLERRVLTSLTLYSDTISLTLTASDLKPRFWHLWKRAQPFHILIKRLRQQYGQ